VGRKQKQVLFEKKNECAERKDKGEQNRGQDQDSREDGREPSRNPKTNMIEALERLHVRHAP
jgi:hypothetical protein